MANQLSHTSALSSEILCSISRVHLTIWSLLFSWQSVVTKMFTKDLLYSITVPVHIVKLDIKINYMMENNATLLTK